MIIAIEGADRNRFPAEIDAMHRIRASVFADRLGWDVQVVNGREVDRFDDANPLYLLSIDPLNGNVRGALRLLPTTGPNMLRDVFPVLLADGEPIESPTIWESTRFCVHKDYLAERTPSGLNVATCELLAGIVEIGMMAGLRFVVSVYDARMARILKAAGCPAELVGAPQRIGEVMTYAGLFDISKSALAAIRNASGIETSVLGGEMPAIFKAA